MHIKHLLLFLIVPLFTFSQMTENEDIKDDFHENIDIDEDIKQEEELLDIPTFLRRQAN